MKIVPCYTISPNHLQKGIELTDGLIQVGESGRGRSLTEVPPPPEVEIVNGRLMSVGVSHPDAVAVILIRDHSGFRGSWGLYSYAESFCPEYLKSGNAVWLPPEGCHDSCPGCGVYPYNYHELVPNKPLFPEAIGYEIASGWRAQGHAGRAGGGPEYLIAARPSRFSIRVTGRTYGNPDVYNVIINEDGTINLDDAEGKIKSSMSSSRW